jgi:hypothetical protein
MPHFVKMIRFQKAVIGLIVGAIVGTFAGAVVNAVQYYVQCGSRGCGGDFVGGRDYAISWA